MSELVITLLRVECDEVTDDFLEGLTDEVGWRLTASDRSGERSETRSEIPMPELASVEAGSRHVLNRELSRLGPEWTGARLEFWDKDTFSANDLLGCIEIQRDGRGGITLSTGADTEDLGGGAFRLTGEQGDYKVWLAFEEHSVETS